MLLEGLIEEGLDYDDWISHSHTWLSLGDKCAMHHMYSLATDLYGLGIMKDPDAFRKPMLWLRFAKACKRCGRAADGLLAVKVSSSCSVYLLTYINILTASPYLSLSVAHSKRSPTTPSTRSCCALRPFGREDPPPSASWHRAR